jgi:ABC-type lipoprotein export system ATPase subunit
MGGGLNAYNGNNMQPSPLLPNANVNMMGGQTNENNNYHFRFKIAIVGDSGVGKTTFLDAISQTLGSVVENEESSELHIKVRTIYFFQVTS